MYIMHILGAPMCGTGRMSSVYDLFPDPSGPPCSAEKEEKEVIGELRVSSLKFRARRVQP